MRKFLAMMLSLALCAVVGLSTTGCSKKKTTGTPSGSASASASASASPSPSSKSPSSVSPVVEMISLETAAITAETDDGKWAGKVKITATRPKGMDEEITLAFDGFKDGIEGPKDAKIAEKAKDVEIEVKVTKPGEYTVKVTGKGKKDAKGTDLKVKVTKKAADETVKGKLEVDESKATVETEKDGDKKGTGTGKVTIKIKRQNKTDGEVTLKFTCDKEGITIKDATIKAGEDSAKDVEIAIDAKAKAGDVEVTVTATSMGGTPPAEVTGTGKLKLTIKPKA